MPRVLAQPGPLRTQRTGVTVIAVRSLGEMGRDGRGRGVGGLLTTLDEMGYCTAAGEAVWVGVQSDSARGPANGFLYLLERSLAQTRPLDAALVAQGRALVEGLDVDLDAALPAGGATGAGSGRAAPVRRCGGTAGKGQTWRLPG